MSCQAGLVNITKLRQLDLAWNIERCVHSMQLTSEVYDTAHSRA